MNALTINTLGLSTTDVHDERIRVSSRLRLVGKHLSSRYLNFGLHDIYAVIWLLSLSFLYSTRHTCVFKIVYAVPINSPIASVTLLPYPETSRV